MSDDTRGVDPTAAPESSGGASGSGSTLRTEFTIAGPLPVPIEQDSASATGEQDLRAHALADAEGLTGPEGLTDVTYFPESSAHASRSVDGLDGVTTSGTIVIEDGVIPRRLRRPLDLARLALALAITGR